MDTESGTIQRSSIELTGGGPLDGEIFDGVIYCFRLLIQPSPSGRVIHHYMRADLKTLAGHDEFRYTGALVA